MQPYVRATLRATHSKLRFTAIGFHAAAGDGLKLASAEHTDDGPLNLVNAEPDAVSFPSDGAPVDVYFGNPKGVEAAQGSFVLRIGAKEGGLEPDADTYASVTYDAPVGDGVAKHYVIVLETEPGVNVLRHTGPIEGAYTWNWRHMVKDAGTPMGHAYETMGQSFIVKTTLTPNSNYAEMEVELAEATDDHDLYKRKPYFSVAPPPKLNPVLRQRRDSFGSDTNSPALVVNEGDLHNYMTATESEPEPRPEPAPVPVPVPMPDAVLHGNSVNDILTWRQRVYNTINYAYETVAYPFGFQDYDENDVEALPSGSGSLQANEEVSGTPKSSERGAEVQETSQGAPLAEDGSFDAREASNNMPWLENEDTRAQEESREAPSPEKDDLNAREASLVASQPDKDSVSAPAADDTPQPADGSDMHETSRAMPPPQDSSTGTRSMAVNSVVSSKRSHASHGSNSVCSRECHLAATDDHEESIVLNLAVSHPDILLRQPYHLLMTGVADGSPTNMVEMGTPGIARYCSSTDRKSRGALTYELVSRRMHNSPSLVVGRPERLYLAISWQVNPGKALADKEKQESDDSRYLFSATVLRTDSPMFPGHDYSQKRLFENVSTLILSHNAHDWIYEMPDGERFRLGLRMAPRNSGQSGGARSAMQSDALSVSETSADDGVSDRRLEPAVLDLSIDPIVETHEDGIRSDFVGSMLFVPSSGYYWENYDALLQINKKLENVTSWEAHDIYVLIENAEQSPFSLCHMYGAPSEQADVADKQHHVMSPGKFDLYDHSVRSVDGMARIVYAVQHPEAHLEEHHAFYASTHRQYLVCSYSHTQAQASVVHEWAHWGHTEVDGAAVARFLDETNVEAIASPGCMTESSHPVLGDTVMCVKQYRSFGAPNVATVAVGSLASPSTPALALSDEVALRVTLVNKHPHLKLVSASALSVGWKGLAAESSGARSKDESQLKWSFAELPLSVGEGRAVRVRLAVDKPEHTGDLEAVELVVRSYPAQRGGMDDFIAYSVLVGKPEAEDEAVEEAVNHDSFPDSGLDLEFSDDGSVFREEYHETTYDERSNECFLERGLGETISAWPAVAETYLRGDQRCCITLHLANTVGDTGVELVATIAETRDVVLPKANDTENGTESAAAFDMPAILDADAESKTREEEHTSPLAAKDTDSISSEPDVAAIPNTPTSPSPSTIQSVPSSPSIIAASDDATAEIHSPELESPVQTVDAATSPLITAADRSPVLSPRADTPVETADASTSPHITAADNSPALSSKADTPVQAIDASTSPLVVVADSSPIPSLSLPPPSTVTDPLKPTPVPMPSPSVSSPQIPLSSAIFAPQPLYLLASLPNYPSMPLSSDIVSCMPGFTSSTFNLFARTQYDVPDAGYSPPPQDFASAAEYLQSLPPCYPLVPGYSPPPSQQDPTARMDPPFSSQDYPQMPSYSPSPMQASASMYTLPGMPSAPPLPSQGYSHVPGYPPPPMQGSVSAYTLPGSHAVDSSISQS
ncbi:hypothetical protein THASP1DRAFT_28925 [Thamnocephalis sphaerospora]|uniref:Uncharacterized protein n=1 Tax=Thamnocephalis sphaerospora TaxID=78915 RepID=A0A4P9XT20_9FUNG|nr:hypothetical protein THASP1DRAFT_28925 [Thamnocephalis sphaerospora]|eukprot:RKP09276.1 hypothetical protein THASP1DRAFT_28925 [Thamnocephalis sphaerospora]